MQAHLNNITQLKHSIDTFYNMYRLNGDVNTLNYAKQRVNELDKAMQQAFKQGITIEQVKAA